MSKETDTIKTNRIDPPARIANREDTLEIWNYLCDDLASRDLLSTSYIIPITLLTDNLVTYHELKASYDDSGPLIPILSKDDGETIVSYKENPLFSMLKRTELIIMKLCEKFGLNPRDAVYVTNPDIKMGQAEKGKLTKNEPDKKGIVYFN
jgi:phage terminase small subunit